MIQTGVLSLINWHSENCSVNQQAHRIIVIVGPTAVGKTEVALRVASTLQVPILSFDSRQCYRELNIGVARPSHEQLQQVPHYFIADHSVAQPIQASYYEQYATQKVAELIALHGQLVMVGGTGLYWKAFWEGLDEIPMVDPSVRELIRAQYQQEGLAWLHAMLAKEDPLYSTQGEMQNPHRMMRALEVVQSTGQSILSFQKGKVKKQPYQLLGIGLEQPRAVLYQRINNRVDVMMQQGLLAEVTSLQSYKESIALKTVGYSELFDYLEQRLTLEQAIEQIKLNTRHYAKRQMTWFKKDPSFTWYSPDQLPTILGGL